MQRLAKMELSNDIQEDMLTCPIAPTRNYNLSPRQAYTVKSKFEKDETKTPKRVKEKASFCKTAVAACLPSINLPYNMLYGRLMTNARAMSN